MIKAISKKPTTRVHRLGPEHAGVALCGLEAAKVSHRDASPLAGAGALTSQAITPGALRQTAQPLTQS